MVVDSWGGCWQWRGNCKISIFCKSMSTGQKRAAVDSWSGLSTVDNSVADLLPTSVPLSSKELVFEFQSGYSCLVGTLSAGIISLLKYTIIISSFSRSFSRFLLSAVALYFLLDFFTKSTFFCVWENQVEPWTMLLYANFAWCKAWFHALDLSP